LHCCIVAIASIAQTASLQWFQCAENKYKSHDINILAWMRFDGTIVAVLKSRKKIHLRLFAK
jgi:hypothetical protein